MRKKPDFFVDKHGYLNLTPQIMLKVSKMLIKRKIDGMNKRQWGKLLDMMYTDAKKILAEK
jgi:hypothetical protein